MIDLILTDQHIHKINHVRTHTCEEKEQKLRRKQKGVVGIYYSQLGHKIHKFKT